MPTSPASGFRAWILDALPLSLLATGFYALCASLDLSTTVLGLAAGWGWEANPLAPPYHGASFQDFLGREAAICLVFFLANLAIWPLRHRVDFCDPARPRTGFLAFCKGGMLATRAPYRRWFAGEIGLAQLVKASWDANLPYNLATLLATPLMFCFVRLAAAVNNSAVVLWPDGEILAIVHLTIYEIFFRTLTPTYTLGFILFALTFTCLVAFPVSWSITTRMCRKIAARSGGSRPS